MKVASKAFDPDGKIPCKYTCDGRNLSPPLSISDVPPETKSLVVILDEVEVPGRYRKLDKGVYWLVFNIPQNVRDIEEGRQPDGSHAVVETGKLKYHGPCPSEGEHLYRFKVHAVDVELDHRQNATARQVTKAMAGHILATAELMARYEMTLVCQVR